MIREVSFYIPIEKDGNENFIKEKIFCELSKSNINIKNHKVEFRLLKKSIDARRKKVKLFLRYQIFIAQDIPSTLFGIPKWQKCSSEKSVLIIGAGPAGLFAALKFLENGIQPVIIERGSVTAKRKRDIAKISTKNFIDENSNYCFGEGGAGTFSDGKLFTRSKKRGDIFSVLKIFVHFGANEKILTDSHPHIGSDKLPLIINAIRNFIIKLGGIFYFDTLCYDILTKEKNSFVFATGIKTRNTKTFEEKIFYASAIVLACGHSANDIYKLLAKKNPLALEEKTFAMGVRVEHPRKLIDEIQFHKNKNLRAAEYRFTSQQNGRGVYTFCMCPGGFIVPSASENKSIVVNGMSSALRNSKWSNSAVVVEIPPSSIPFEFVEKSKEIANGSKCLAGLLWRTFLEQKTFANGQFQKAPAQRLEDFLQKKNSATLPSTSYAPGVVLSRLDLWLPNQITSRLCDAFKDFEKKMKGFISHEAILVALESRTSTPIRILRNKENCENPVFKRLFPAGEGAGYSGGIVSSAMDGEKVAQCCISIIKNQF